MTDQSNQHENQKSVSAPNFKEYEAIPYFHENHKRPKTRRDFLAQGFLGVSASVMLPSFASMMAKSAFAESVPIVCEIPEFQGGLPYLCIDVAGGMNIAGSNVIVGIKDGGEIQEDFGANPGDFIRLGITPEEHPSYSGKVEGKYGLKFHRASGILQGMNSVLADVRMQDEAGSDLGPIENGIDGLIFCTRTSDDTASNQINTVYMANKAGAKGELVHLIGNQATDSGGRSLAPGGQVNLALRPTQISSNSQASGLLSLGGKLSGADYLNGEESQDKVKRFMDRIARMSKSKLEELTQKESLNQIQSVLSCSFDNAKQLFDVYSPAQLNPGNDQAVIDIFNNSSEEVASVSKLVLDKIAGAGTITIGGGDYHGGNISRTHIKDVQVGEAIGRCIKLAAAKQENVAIHLYTDGGVSADTGGASQPALVPGVGDIPKVRWTGDSGTRSAALLIFYKHGHDGTSLVLENIDRIPRRQVGNFIRKGGVQLNTVIGNSTENLWKAIMLNYLAAQGKGVEEFEKLFGDLPPDHDSLIRMKPIV